MAEKVAVPSKQEVSLVHPETKEPKKFSFAHAQNILKHQLGKKRTASQSWTLAEGQNFTIDKDGNLIAGAVK